MWALDTALAVDMLEVFAKVISSPAEVNLIELDAAIQWVEDRGTIRRLGRGADPNAYSLQFEAAAVEIRVLRRQLTCVMGIESVILLHMIGDSWKLDTFKIRLYRRSTGLMKPLLLSLFGALSISAQPFSFGIKGGVPLTDFINAPSSLPPRFVVVALSFQTTTNRYLIGPTVEVRFPFGFALEVDALYRHLNYSSLECLGGAECTIGHTTGNTWEFPLLAKYRFPLKRVRPYVDAGIAWDTLTGLSQTRTSFSGFTGAPLFVVTTSHPPELHRNTTDGFVVGGGIDFQLLFLHISPEIRYTHWSNQQLSLSNQNQAEFMLGLTFGKQLPP